MEELNTAGDGKSMKKDYTIYLTDILIAIKDIENFVGDADFKKFLKDKKTASAVIRKFEIIGEAAKRIPKEMQMKYQEIPWKEMAGMRDRLIHLYREVDYDIVWKAVKESLPELKNAITAILKTKIKKIGG